MSDLKPIYWGLLALVLTACEQPEDPNPPAESTASVTMPEGIAETQAALPASPFYALRTQDNRWPDLTPDLLSSDMLANNYYIILDGSGSMASDTCAPGSTKMDVAKAAVKQFIQQISPTANIGLFVFDRNGIQQRVELAAQNREQLFNKIDQIQPDGHTPLKTALNFGYEQLSHQGARQMGYGEYHLVVVTDGLASATEEPDAIVETIIEQSPVMIHSVGFCIDDKHSLNQPGKTAYTAAANADELQQGLAAVLAESATFDPDQF